MQLVDIGTTVEGRTQLLAVISSEENLRASRRATRRLRSRSRSIATSGPRRSTDAQARRLARDGKAVMWIDFGLHSTEVAHAQTAPWMAWKVVTEDTDEMRVIRDNVILLLVPNMNPDGTTLVAEWYMKHVGKPWEMTPPVLYQKYVGHDNNRDWFMFNQPESRNVARQLYEEWFPQIVYNQHQTAPFPARIFVPPFEDPTNLQHPAAGDARHQPGRRRDHAPARSGRQASARSRGCSSTPGGTAACARRRTSTTWSAS